MGLNLYQSILMKNKNDISCKWLKERRVVVNPDGQVMPCCYLANRFYREEYPYNKEEHNIFNKPLEEILGESEWFNKELPESWDNEPFKQCIKFCSSKGESFNKLKRVVK